MTEKAKLPPPGIHPKAYAFALEQLARGDGGKSGKRSRVPSEKE